MTEDAKPTDETTDDSGPDGPVRHPSLVTLREFLSGELDDSTARRVEEHLSLCDECVARLSNVDGNESDDVDPESQPASGRTSIWDGPRDDRSVAKVVVDRETSSGFRSLQRVHVEGYEILSELGRGGMGVVYRAVHRRLKRQVALKVILSQRHSSEQDRQRFRIEAETVAKLQHPGIVQIYEVGEHDGHPFMALELVEGHGLHHVLGAEARSPRWAAKMILQLAPAIHLAHQKGIVHRDLKPENILLVENSDSDTQTGSGSDHGPRPKDAVVVPVAKITDFGLARQMNSESDLTQTGVVMGTPAYMAPEQARGDGRHAGPAADIHALGALLYQCMTGRPPFVSSDMHQTLAMILDDDPVAPRSLNSGVPRDLETICLKCLMKDPAARYESAAHLAADLELFLDGEPITARSLSLSGRLYRWARQKPFLASGFGILAVLFVLHLFALHVLKVPANVRMNDFLVTLFVCVATAITICQRMIESKSWQEAGRFAWIATATLTVTAALTVDSGPQSAPVTIYFVTIVCSVLIGPRVALIWFATSMAVLSYVWLNVFAIVFRPEVRVAPQNAIAFVLTLILAGACMHLVVRRVHHRE